MPKKKQVKVGGAVVEVCGNCENQGTKKFPILKLCFECEVDHRRANGLPDPEPPFKAAKKAAKKSKAPKTPKGLTPF